MPKSLTTTAPTFLRRHPLGDLAERVLEGDLDEVGAHHISDLGHGAILSQRSSTVEAALENKTL